MVEGAVDIIHMVVFVLAILWVLSQLVVTRRKLRTGQVVIPPLFAATLVFMYPCGRSPRGLTAASALVISTEFRAGPRLVVVPSRREADAGLLRTLGRAAQSR